MRTTFRATFESTLRTTVFKEGIPTALDVFGSDVLIWSDASNAASITESAGRVSQWDDLSGNNNHWTQSTGSSQPFTGNNTQNGRNVINFDKSSTIYFESPSVSLTDYEAFFVVKDTNTYPIASSRLGTLMSQFGSGMLIMTQYSFGGGTTAQPQFRTEFGSSITHYIDNVSTTNPVNLTADQMYNFNVSETGTYSKTGILGIGVIIDSLSSLQNGVMDLGEIVIVDTSTTPITSQQRADWQSAVEAKWGI